VSDGRDAAIIITECERLPELLAPSSLPAAILLGGGGYALLLRNALLPRFAKGWKPQSPSTEDALLSLLRGIPHAT